ncbi:hypothetical protein X566_24510 [Afipia sp. P52-10]|nr:hypothetical protein X566_24510 [Afipia sp. P52-10]
MRFVLPVVPMGLSDLVNRLQHPTRRQGLEKSILANKSYKKQRRRAGEPHGVFNLLAMSGPDSPGL